ncbi:MAG: gluconokinase [Tunicatimonas sp.]|uniref:gluconokinase n=1 Tax=Tunicatimonas sp. TaxID=1940096 RepID=UPI003C74ED26
MNQVPIMLGIDVGTTSVKVLAADIEGKNICAEDASYSLHQPQDGYREQDPREILEAVHRTVKAVLEQLNEPIAGVSFSTAMHSLLAVDKDGNSITPMLTWADTRSQAYAEELRSSSLGDVIYQKGGAPIHAMLPLCKIAWLRDHQPNIFKQAYKFLSFKEWLLYQWLGEYVVDYSMATATGLFNQKTLGWNEDALAFARIDSEQLSKPVPTTYVLQGLNKKVAEATGLPADIPIVMGASDGCLANLYASGLNPREATLSLGTSGAIRLISRNTTPDKEMRIFNYLLTEDHHVLGGPTNNGGIILNWLHENLYQGKCSYEEVLTKAAHVEPGTDRLVCLPYFHGERAPFWNERIQGGYFGVDPDHKVDYFARAALEGVIYNMYSIGQGLEDAAGSFDAIWADGGVTRSDFMVQLIADIFSKPVYVAESHHGVAEGAIMLGSYALGLVDSLEDVVKNTKKEKEFIPNLALQEVYQDQYARFREWGKVVNQKTTKS